MTPVAEKAASEPEMHQVVVTQVTEQSESTPLVPSPTVSAPAVSQASVQPAAAEAPTPVVTPQPVVADKLDLGQTLQASGLQLVETRFTAEIVPEPAFVPAKRERRPPPSSLNEPLAQVETGKSGPAVPPA